VLFVAGYELIESRVRAEGSTTLPGTEPDGRIAKIVHHAVEQTKSLASPAEARLVNAVVRKLAAALAVPAPVSPASPEVLAEYFSHPAWLIRNWLAQFGAESTRALLEWNQRPAPMYARWRAGGREPPGFLKPTSWVGFFEIPSGHWPEVEPLLKGGDLYLQDPATRLPVDLLAPQPGETVLDLCAAPGGKSLLIADAMKTGWLVSIDLPGARIDRLKVALVQGDLLEGIAPVLREHQLPGEYPAVLIDLPCSNTGVMRHRVDVKWRLQAGDFKKHPRQQLSLLHAAARLVAAGGRIVYSTCSIDTEENEHVVREFLLSRAAGPFTLEKSVVSLPWVTGHDGGAAFLLRRGG
jgi:16S rRNA (cytosine967-C5)-methyltransferase